MARRGIAVLAVLVVLAMGALAGLVALVASRAASDASYAATRGVQSRLTLRSGVLAIGALAGDQREAVLGGGDLVLDDFDPLYESGEVEGVFALDGRVSPEPQPLDALLDVNTATPEMLAALPGVDDALAARIAAALPVRSLRELLAVEGVTAELLFGRPGRPSAASDGPPLAALLTVGSAAPNVSTGVGGGPVGRERLQLQNGLGDGVGEELARLIDEHPALRGLGEGFVRDLRDLDSPPTTREAMYLHLVTVGVGGDRVEDGFARPAAVMDLVCFSDRPSAGRVDINRAPVEVLAALPGLDEAAAGRIVDMRQRLAPEVLADVLWPVRENALMDMDYAPAIERVTTRSVRWVMRLEAGERAISDRTVGIDSPADARAVRRSAAEGGALDGRVAMDLLVDFTGGRPVVTPLGDATIAADLDALAAVLPAGEADTIDGIGQDARDADDAAAPPPDDGARDGEDDGQDAAGMGETEASMRGVPRGVGGGR